MLPWDVVEPVLAEPERSGIVVFPEVGHSPHNHQPELFAELLAAFLDDRLGTLVPEEPGLRLRQAPIGA